MTEDEKDWCWKIDLEPDEPEPIRKKRVSSKHTILNNKGEVEYVYYVNEFGLSELIYGKENKQ